ncbi:uncharacterized protein LOC111283439 isoform X2 [Durio zibethinus]|uniref:Uncharacterized protein LOC111283439 isoform X2 n=1 Tax=Durio zibethinus TaxID=66656 RepID=A0A6P5XHS0_DURZI|nr:uncharacterized protein LOC111283439 isoform X2 [Durio zibethinus]
MDCLCVPEGEFEELLEHVPLSTRRKLLLSSTVSFKNQVKSSNSLVDQHLPKEDGPNWKVTADATNEVATNEHSLDSGAVARCSQYTTSCQGVGLPINGNSQGGQAGKLTGTEDNARASGLEKINVGVPLPPNPVLSNVSDIIKVECAHNMLRSLSKDDTNSSAGTGDIASCQDVGLPINGNSEGSQADQLKGTEADADADASGLDKINVGIPLLQNPMPLNASAIKNADCADNMLFSLSKDDRNSSANTGLMAENAMDKRLSEFTFDELDHIVLKERQKLLLKRKLTELEKPALEGTSVGLAEDLMEYSAKIIKEELQPIDGECMTARNQFNDIPVGSASDLSSCSVNGSSGLEYSAGRNKEELQFVNGESWLVGNELNVIPNRSASDLQRTSATGTEAARSENRMEESNIICPSERTSLEFKSHDGDDYVPASTNNIYNSTLNTSVKVKVEPLDYNNLQNPEKNTSDNMVSIKYEEDISDRIDYMLLRDRMKLLTSVEEFELKASRNFECLRKTDPAACGFSSIVSESAETLRVNRPRKRKKTATDSVLTALEEDAPGLLKVLLDNGVSVDEIKLYGESENDDALDESFNEGSFSELEAVMTKLFSQPSSLLRFATLRCSKGSKPSYCVACLFSLVEQTRYLQFRRWPVEWGWCRDLQSFIFVFKRHHRIVLERPEYGYATYFFELLDSLPIDWQLKRLVTAMKLTSCGRITLIENKRLSVGEDLTEGEAKVLMEYGWMPNTGLGTMLNYCDRVVHDRKNESDSSEWRSKIGKLLVDGYNGGTIVSTSLVEDVIQYRDGEKTLIKLEF